MTEKKELVITEECRISIPKTGMIVEFDGERCIIGFLHDTDIAVDGDLRIATKGNFEVVSMGDSILSTGREGKVHLGYADIIYGLDKEKK